MRRWFNFDKFMISCLILIVISVAVIVIHTALTPEPSHNVEGQVVSISFDDQTKLVDSRFCDRLKEKVCQKEEQHQRTIRMQLKNSSGTVNLVFEKLSAFQFQIYQKNWLVGYCVHISYDLPNTIDSYLKSCPDK